jgi:hypothetical protein
MRALCAFCALVIIAHSHGYPSLRFKVPNGNRVPCPPGAQGCIPAEEADQPESTCKGLGHYTCTGGTLPLNAFGQSFKNAGYQWTAALCCEDSDGDGQTNGEELGDPNCMFADVWQEDTPLTSALRFWDVSHPGVPGHTSKNVTQSLGTAACLSRASTSGSTIPPSEFYLPPGEFFLPGERRYASTVSCLRAFFAPVSPPLPRSLLSSHRIAEPYSLRRLSQTFYIDAFPIPVRRTT